ncbi:hypothetical protein [Streptomyces fructofermentans]|uniref:Lipoprotein n=1 Tax=Streptomyces fructofermentans TaxID=152141 RepID=A0A918K7P3_9ACTN|nr:hypothetical protein [Streptomyces fructofermentans]GGX53911.1 hypothetical protein GCM10010515_21400 [Streptomyces fructofermentans]
MREARGAAARRRRVAGALLVLSLVAAATGCQQSAGTGNTGTGRTAAPAPTRSPGYGTVFLGVDECSSFGRESFTEVPCTSEKAAARVLARHEGRVGGGQSCPAASDFVLHISEQKPAADEDGDGAVPQGYACMRNLEDPHPGDPGGGGGPRTVVGDCVYSAGRGEVRETSCAGGGATAPEFKVTRAVARRADCPASTALYVQLGGAKPVGCARPV